MGGCSPCERHGLPTRPHGCDSTLAPWLRLESGRSLSQSWPPLLGSIWPSPRSQPEPRHGGLPGAAGYIEAAIALGSVAGGLLWGRRRHTRTHSTHLAGLVAVL